VINLYEINLEYALFLIRLKVKKPYIYVMTLDDWIGDIRANQPIPPTRKS